MWSTKIKWFALGALMVVCFALVERELALNTEYRTSYFYLVPTVLVAWRSGVGLALAMGVFSACAWLLVKHWFSGGFATGEALLWNGIAISGYFVIIAYLVAKWRQAIQDLAALATTDALTGAFNKRGFSERLQREIARINRYGHAFSLSYLDLDDFKGVNDHFGHGAGDLLLRQVTDAIKSAIRSSDTVGRLGGDEFAILFPEAGQLEARQIIDKILPRLSSNCRVGGQRVTFSAGVVTCLGFAPSMDELMRRLDRLMYEVKGDGKNSVRYEIVTRQPLG